MATPQQLFEYANKYFKVFIEDIIGLHNAPFHDDLDDNLTNPLYKKIVISFARGHGKSTHLSVAYPLWEIAKNHNVRILLISSTASISRGFMSEIIGHIEKNDKYKMWANFIDPESIGVVPKMKNYKKQQENWAGDSIKIARSDVNMKDPTIHGVGLFGSILSKRADIIICDDVVNQENSATEEQRRKVIDWIRTTVMPVLVPGGKFIYLGNTWHQDDLVANLLKDPQFDYRQKMPAILHESNHVELWDEWAQILLNEGYVVEERKINAERFYQANKEKMDEGVQLLWPERFSYKDLYMIRLSDGYSFARMFQCDPSNRPDQKFKDEWLDMACKKGATLRLQDEVRDGIIVACTASGLDLAISEKESSDDTCFLTLDKVKYGSGDIKNGDYVIRNIRRGKMTPNEVRLMVKAHDEKVKPDGIRVESVGYQEAMVRDLEEWGIPVRSYHTGREKNDPNIGVNSLAILAELGKLVFPYDKTDPNTIRLVNQLLNEMRAFPDGHTGDSLMAFWFAFSEIRDIAGMGVTVPSITAGIAKETPTGSELNNPEARKKGEKEADVAKILESEAEREFLRQQMGNMGGFWGRH